MQPQAVQGQVRHRDASRPGVGSECKVLAQELGLGLHGSGGLERCPGLFWVPARAAVCPWGPCHLSPPPCLGHQQLGRRQRRLCRQQDGVGSAHAGVFLGESGGHLEALVTGVRTPLELVTALLPVGSPAPRWHLLQRCPSSTPQKATERRVICLRAACPSLRGCSDQYWAPTDCGRPERRLLLARLCLFPRSSHRQPEPTSCGFLHLGCDLKQELARWGRVHEPGPASPVLTRGRPLCHVRGGGRPRAWWGHREAS